MSYMSSYTIEEAIVVNETPNGIWIQAPIFDSDEFIPQTQIHVDSEVYKSGTEGNLIISAWLARQRGWLE